VTEGRDILWWDTSRPNPDRWMITQEAGWPLVASRFWWKGGRSARRSAPGRIPIGGMALRWAAAGMLAAQGQFRLPAAVDDCP
jgi:hypothetical protein